MGPFSGEIPREEPQVQRRLTDRAVFLGETGRVSSKENDTRQKAFSKLVRTHLGDGEEDEAGARNGDSPEPEEAKDMTLEKNAEADKMSRDGGFDEAEKHGGGLWGRPTPLLGMGMMPTFNLVNIGSVEGGGRSENGKQARSLDSVSEEKAQVEPKVLEGLRQAGMRQPLTGLQDPRLTGDKVLLKQDDGWHSQALAGGTLHTWQLVDRSTYQRVHVVEGEMLLESSAGTLRQVLQKKGGQFFSKLSRQDGNASFRL